MLCTREQQGIFAGFFKYSFTSSWKNRDMCRVFLLAVGVKILESVLGVGFLRVRPGGFAATLLFLRFLSEFAKVPFQFLDNFLQKNKAIIFFILSNPKSKT